MRSPTRPILFAAILLTGCSGMPDQERTVSEGALIGTTAGAVAGAGVGYLVGGGRGAGYGAAIGAGAGLIGGTQLGKHAARRKAEFSKAADYMDACIAAAAAANQQLTLHNQSLAQHLAILDAEIAQTRATERQRQTLAADMQGAGQQLGAVTEELALQNDVLRQERAAQTPERTERLEQEIRTLEAGKAELEALMKTMRTMDATASAS